MNGIDYLTSSVDRENRMKILVYPHMAEHQHPLWSSHLSASPQFLGDSFLSSQLAYSLESQDNISHCDIKRDADKEKIACSRVWRDELQSIPIAGKCSPGVQCSSGLRTCPSLVFVIHLLWLLCLCLHERKRRVAPLRKRTESCFVTERQPCGSIPKKFSEVISRRCSFVAYMISTSPGVPLSSPPLHL
jgi:hypothetical protein